MANLTDDGTTSDDSTYTETDTASNTTTGTTETDTPGDTTDDDGGILSGLSNLEKVTGFLSLIGVVIAGGEVKKAAEYGMLNGEGDPQLIYYLFTDPLEWARRVVVELIYEDVLLPIGRSVFDAGVATVNALLVLFFGGDKAIGIAEGTQIGIADIPFLIVSPVAGFITWYTEWIVGGIEQLNSGVAGWLSQFGIASPIIVNLMFVGEIGLLFWITWAAINAIDVPLVRVVDFFKALFKPFTRLMGWFR